MQASTLRKLQVIMTGSCTVWRPHIFAGAGTLSASGDLARLPPFSARTTDETGEYASECQGMNHQECSVHRWAALCVDQLILKENSALRIRIFCWHAS